MAMRARSATNRRRLALTHVRLTRMEAFADGSAASVSSAGGPKSPSDVSSVLDSRRSCLCRISSHSHSVRRMLCLCASKTDPPAYCVTSKYLIQDVPLIPDAVVLQDSSLSRLLESA
jgi:hypothetical protein